MLEASVPGTGPNPHGHTPGSDRRQRWVRRWTGAPDQWVQEAGSLAFRSVAAPAVRAVDRAWFLGTCVVFVYWFGFILWPRAAGVLWLAAALHRWLPQVFLPPDAPEDVLVDQHTAVVAAIGCFAFLLIAWVAAGRQRDRLAAAHAAADARVGQFWVRDAGGASAAVALFMVGHLLAVGFIIMLAVGWAIQAGQDVILRLQASPGRRPQVLGRLLVREVRSLRFMLAVGMGLLLGVQAIWLERPPLQSPWDQARIVRSDPQVVAARAATEQAYQAALRTSAAPAGLVSLHGLWMDDPLFATNVAEALEADRTFRARLDAFTAFWDGVRARPVTTADMRAACFHGPDAAECRTTQAGLVDGSDGRLAYQFSRPVYGLLDGGKDDGVETRNDAVDIYQQDGPDRWHLAVHAPFSSSDIGVPRLVAAPGATLLVLPAHADGLPPLGGDATQAYVREDAGWHWLETGRWLAQAAAGLPPHACLLQTTYDGANEPLYSDIQPDYATLTATGLFGPDPADPGTAQGRFAAQLGIENGALVLRHQDLFPAPDRRGWLRRLFATPPRC